MATAALATGTPGLRLQTQQVSGEGLGEQPLADPWQAGEQKGMGMPAAGGQGIPDRQMPGARTDGLISHGGAPALHLSGVAWPGAPSRGRRWRRSPDSVADQ